MLRPALIVHGGAGVGSAGLSRAQRGGCLAAVNTGWQVLARGGSALDSVCAAVAVLEDDPAFNAGVGSCLTSQGTVEMDASVMAGTSLRAGAGALVRTLRHPIDLARAVLDDGRHVLLAGTDADAFGTARGLQTCSPETFITPRQRRRWQAAADAGADSAGTVGAAAVDRSGYVAAATSTGGLLNKRPGRIGDSAIIGAGTYADDRLGAASATGDGEAIMRIALAKLVVDGLRDGAAPADAARSAIRTLAGRTGASGGVIVVDRLGRFAQAHNTPYMIFGYMRGDLSEPVVEI